MNRTRMWTAPAVALAVALGLAHGQAQAGYSKVVVFGDSLSDGGNVYLATSGGTPASPPYYQGHYSNGPVWIERLATGLGLAAPTPSLAGGANFAFGGAETGTGNSTLGTPNLLTQVAQFQAGGGTLSPAVLVSVWAGANDFLNAGQTNPGVPVNNIATAITQLAALGGKEFVVPNLPTLGNLPATNTLPQAQRDGLNALTAAFNLMLDGTVAQLQASLGVNIHEVNVAALVASAQANPALYGFTNVTTGALPDNAPDPNKYLFWDSVHPTAVSQQYIANIALTAVPEPGSVVLLACGSLLALAPALRPRRKASRAPLESGG